MNTTHPPEQTQHAVKAALLSRIDEHAITVGVIGLGYVGLPFMVEKAKVGLQVIGFDRNPERVAMVGQGVSYIEDVASADLKPHVEQGRLSTTQDWAALAGADVLVICVPTPLDKNLCPDLMYVRQVSESIAEILRPGQLVCLESTTYPGTTDEVILPILERSGLTCGFDFFLAHSPERVDPGNQRYSTHNTNKVVGGVDASSLEVAQAFYKLAIQHVVAVSSAKVAEMVKVYENTYRAVNIALANEMALLCDAMDLNTWEVLDAAFTKPFGIMPFYPGPGVGGHCIPIDPHYLEWKAREYNFQTKFIALAGETNRKMPVFVVQKLTRMLNRDGLALSSAKILLLGVAYKANLSDYRESPALTIIDLLQAAGVSTLHYHDPFVPEFEHRQQQFQSVALTQSELTQADVVVVLSSHTAVDYPLVAQHALRILDTRNAMREIDTAQKELL